MPQGHLYPHELQTLVMELFFLLLLLLFVVVVVVLAALRGMRDHSSLTGDRTGTPCSGSVES